MTPDSWPDVARIYEQGIATKQATFETKVPTWEAWDLAHRQDCRLIAHLNDKIVGWAALSNVSSRCVYAGVAELSIYIDAAFRGQGIGDLLMENLITESEKQGIWTLLSGIFPENIASLHLHRKHGFTMLGTEERIGKMDDTWRDVIKLQRRSKIVGID
jgi:phosphinothricin acetyltransferase